MIRIISLLFILLYTITSTAKEIEILVIDPKIVMERSLAFSHAKKIIEEKNTEYAMKANSEREKIQKNYESLEANKSILTHVEYEQETRKIEDSIRQHNKQAHQNKVILDNALNKASARIEEELSYIVEEYVKNHPNQDIIIINKLYTLHSSPRLDITTDIINKLNIRLPNIPVAFYEQPQ